MHHVIIQAHEGSAIQTLLDYLRTLGITRVVYPAREYRSERAGRNRGHFREPEYETARLYPRGDDGGFAEEFLRGRDT